ncbi:tripartite tricarboxylate transporter substrate binding protein [Tenuibacillus multivorans]|uniref:Putative tricarboxylic transport membrane protein n=1 Tax=Tenuibacillus multivorans TaxID=237069 RepID=A0A1G9WMJ5_9BACI|nr:tripartite tricarboxylate transporter substrate binding protein [Tenuibacillus multivorans]GEL78005.1 tricarboxylic transport TctC [Tenuibacillus multivorans]SDM85754.1 putative tricarboxylic transport membrane protein [Tenuibacillus multivorans]
MKKLLALSMFILMLLFLAACGGDDTSSEGDNAGEDDTSSEESSGDESSSEGDGEWAPSESIEIVAPAGAGGGWDTTARMSAQVLNEEGIIEQDMGVVNKEGAGGAVGWAYMAEQAGSNHNLFVSSSPILLVPLNGQSEYGHEDFTPIANVIADYGAFAVRDDAEWDNLNELFEDMKEDPQSVTVVGTSSPGSMDHIQFVRFAKAAGVDITKIKYVSAPDAGGITQLLNGSADVFSTGVAEVVEQARAGEIRVLAVTSEERLEGETLSTFPTAMEQGIDESFINWRGFFGPKDMDPAAVEYYEAKFKELSDSGAFADVRSNYGWNEMFMGSEEYQEFLDQEKEALKGLLDELGLTAE